ncbi:uncharacterized protein znf605.S [Xenopus laevis]|uniref:Uncharacterized protein znf605.S n=2 Tax=Xenopus laevis TaxID=8355 RepID=A0A1L8FPW7_XENLA|nr:uncharacterized protein znf605.S [Xenopus laevis]XP_018079546.1 uncharacterized protein znf605.S [Xenopus laevis]OCT73623.1 hypothetical protein XELAEV_18032585mg [Xenopus laevis]
MQGKERSTTALDGCVTTRQRLSSATNQDPDVALGSASDTGQYLCMECSETFSSKVQLSSHRQSHVAKKPFMCSYCGRGFHHQIFLQVHERSHEGGATSHQLTAVKPGASRVISTRSCRTVAPLTSDCVNVQPIPSKPELLLNSLVQFRKGHGSQQSPAPIECVTRLSRSQAQPCAQRKDSAEKRSPIELRVSRFSDTTVHLMDAFGNSIELLTEVFSTYTMNGPKQNPATHVPSSVDSTPCEQRTDRTQQEKNDGETLTSNNLQSHMPPQLVPHTDTPTVCPIETDVGKMESDFSPGAVVCSAAPYITTSETPMHNESERLTSGDPELPIETLDDPIETLDDPIETLDDPIEALDDPIETLDDPIETLDEPIETLDDPLSKGTEPISVPHVITYQVSTELDSPLDGITVSSPPTYSQSVLPSKGHDGPGTNSTEQTDSVPEMDSLEETHNFLVPYEQKQKGSLLAEVTSVLQAEDVRVPGTAQAGGLPEYQQRAAPTDHSEQVGEIDACSVGISTLRTDIAMTSELDSQSDVGNGDHKIVLGQSTQSGVKGVSLVPVNIKQLPSHETAIDLKLSLVQDAHSAATVQGTNCSRGTETTSANVGVGHQHGQDLHCERNAQPVMVYNKAEDGSFPKPHPETGAGDASEMEAAENDQAPPTKKDDYKLIHTNSAASLCDQEPTVPESQDKDDQVSATYRHGQDLRSQEPDRTHAESLDPAIVDHDYSDLRRTLKDTPVLCSPITVEMAREFGDGQCDESHIVAGIHDAPPIGEKNNAQHGEQEQHLLDKRPDLQEGISGNVEKFAESGTAETALILSKDGEPQAMGDLHPHDIMDSTLTGPQPERAECKEDISRWVSSMEASLQEKGVAHETEKGTNTHIGPLAAFIPSSHHNETELNCVAKRSLCKSAPTERKEENKADVALSPSVTNEVELEGTVPCLTCGQHVNGNKSPSHVCSNFSKSSMTVMESKRIEMIPADVKRDLDSITEPPSLEPEEPDAKVNKMYNCPKCDKTFRLPVLLAGHVKCHSSHLCITCGSPMPHKYKMKRLARKCQQCIQNTIVKRQEKRLLSSHYSEEEDMVTSGTGFSTELNEEADLTLSCAPNTEDVLGANSAIELTQPKRPCIKQRAKSADGSLGMEPSIECSEVRKKRGRQPAKGDVIPATVPKVYKCLQCGVSFLQCMFIVKHMKEHSMTQTQPCKCYLIVRRGGKQTLKQCKICREHTKSTALDASQLTGSASEQNLHIHTLGPKKIIKRVRKGDVPFQRPGDKKIPLKQRKYGRKSMAPVRECHDEPHLEKKSQIPPLDGNAELMSTNWEESIGEQSVSGRGTDKRSEDLLLKPHVCDVCSKAFRLPRYLRLHSVSHTGTLCASCGCLFRYKRRAGRPSKKCRLCRMKGRERRVLSKTILEPNLPELPKAHKAEVLSSLPHGKQSKILAKLKAPIQAKLSEAFKKKKFKLLKGPQGHSKKRKLNSMQLEKRKKKLKSIEDLSPPTPKKRGRPPGKPTAHRMLSTVNSPAIKSEGTSVAVSDDGLHPIETTKNNFSGDGKSDEVPTYQILPTMSIKEEPNSSEISSFQCSECGQNFPYKHLLDNHMQTHTGDRPYVCSDCDKCFAKINHLTIHKRVHTGVRPHVCSVCQRSFRQKSSLLAHRYTHTNQPPLLVTSYECSVCLKEFKQNSDLEAHECILPVELPVQCKDCNRVFTNKGRLAVHSRVHTVQTSYPCPICNRSFIYKANLERHQQKHKGEKPFSCAKCGVSFARRKTLERHKLAHGKKGLFSCIHCKKYFLLQTWLFRHLKICQGVNKGKVLKVQKRKKIKEDVEVSSTVSSEEAEKKIIKVENKEQKIKKIMKSKVLGEAKLKSKAAEGSKEEKLKVKATKAEKGTLKKKLTEGGQEKGEGSSVEEEKKPNEQDNEKKGNKQEQIKKGQREFPERANTSDGKPKAKCAAPAKKELLSEEKQKAKSAKKDMLGEEKQKAKGAKKNMLGEEKQKAKGAKKFMLEEKQKAKGAKKNILGEEKQKAKGAKKDMLREEKQKPKGAKKHMLGEEKQKGATTAKKESNGEEKQNVKVAAPTNFELLGEEKLIGKGATTTKKESEEEEKQKARNVIPAKKELIGDEKQKTKGTPPAKKPRLESYPKVATPERMRKEDGKGKEPQGKLQSGTGKK